MAVNQYLSDHVHLGMRPVAESYMPIEHALMAAKRAESYDEGDAEGS